MSATRIVRNSLRDATVRWLVLLGVAGLTAGAGLLTAGAALAGVGAQPGDLELTQAGKVVTSGPLTTITDWESTAACPAGFQVSAQMSEWTTGSTPAEISLISPVTSAGLASPDFTGSLDGSGDPGPMLSEAGISASSPGTVEWVIGCHAGASGTGAVEYEASTFISVAAGATDFTTSSASPTPSPTVSPRPSPTPSTAPTSTPASTPTPTPTPTYSPTPKPSSSPKPTSTLTSRPGPTSSVLPSGAQQTGAGGSSLFGNGLLIALGATLLAGSAAATVLAVRRARALPGGRRPGGFSRRGVAGRPG